MVFAQHCIGRLMLIVVASLSLLGATPSWAKDKNALNIEAMASLSLLYSNEPKARKVGNSAAGTLIFPSIARSGLSLGGSDRFAGEGVLYNKKRKAIGYYNSASQSVNQQSGMQSFSYAVFFMSEAALKKFQKAQGWDVGTASNLVLVDARVGKDLDTKSLKAEAYAFIFNHRGLTSSLALKDQKVTKLKK